MWNISFLSVPQIKKGFLQRLKLSIFDLVTFRYSMATVYSIWKSVEVIVLLYNCRTSMNYHCIVAVTLTATQIICRWAIIQY